MLHHHLKTLDQLKKDYEEKLIKEFPNNIFQFMTEEEQTDVMLYHIPKYIGMKQLKEYETLRDKLIIKYKHNIK